MNGNKPGNQGQSKGSESSIQWMLAGTYGEPTGPYTTEEVIDLIRRGRLLGSEKIRKLPDGKWIEISSEAEFYDRLLEALEESMRPHKAKAIRQEKDDGLVQQPKEQGPQENKDSDQTPPPLQVPPPFQNSRWGETPPPTEKRRESFGQPPPPQSYSLSPEQGQPRILELLPQVPKAPSRKRVLWIPLVLIAAALGLIFVGTRSFNPVTKASKPHLLAPRLSGGQSPASSAMTQEGIRKAVGYFLEDSYQANLNAQNILVATVEGAPSNIEARGLLCLVQRQLWPFVQQDSEDLETVNALTKSTRQMDPIGVNGIYCEVTKMLIAGRNREAKGVLDQALNQTNLSSAPVLYSLKAEIISWERDFATAALYADKARKLWPEWARPHFDYADFLLRSGKPQMSLNVLDEILKTRPAHKKALLEKGVVIYRSFHQSEQAFSLLTSAVAIQDKVENGLLLPAYSALAELYVERKDNKNALKYAEQALILNPGDSSTKDLVVRLGGTGSIDKGNSHSAELIYLGDQFQRSGDCLAAQAEFKAAFDLDPSSGTAALKAAKCLWQLNQSQEAISYLSKAIGADKKLAAAYVLQADYHSQKFNYTSAMQVLTKASQVLTNNYEVLRGYGLVEYRRNNLKEALAYLLRSQKIFENDLETLILLANVYGGLNQYKEASIYASRAIELDSTNAEAQIVFSKIVAQLYGIEQGIARFKELIAKYSYTLDFRLGLADLYRDAERYKLAQDILEQLTEVDPRNKKAWLGLGECYQVQGLSDKAIKAYLSAAILDPSDAEALFRTGRVYLEREKYKDAIVQFQRALKINYLYPRLNYYIGKAYFLNGDYNYALTSAQEERKINPNLADSYLLAGEIYTETKQFQKCAEEYQQAIKLRPLGADLYVKLARCYRQSGSPDIAESMLNIAANQESGNPDIYKEQGAIYETKGDNRSAVAAYNKYLALSPNAPDRKEIEFRINRIVGN